MSHLAATKWSIIARNAATRGVAVSVSDYWSTMTRGMTTTPTTNNNNNNNKADDDDGESKEDPKAIVLDPLIVCGPSGVGKGSIIERFMSEEFGGGWGNKHFGFTTSHTTRAPREGEIDAVHYNFVSHDDMKRLIGLGKFLEHAQVHGNFYGTSWDSVWKVQQEGRRCLLDIDVQGVKRVKALEQQQQRPQPPQQQPQVLYVNKNINGLSSWSSSSSSSHPPQFKPKYVFIAPPSMDVLEKRLVGRGTESVESLTKRTQNARAEVEYGLKEGNFDYVLVNDDLDKACREFELLVRRMYEF